MKPKQLPLGLDIGATRVRLARAERLRSGEIRVVAVAARDVPDGAVTGQELTEPELLAVVIEDARAELGCPQRGCVIALPAAIAMLRLVRFPTMRRSELFRAARFEAERFLTTHDVAAPAIVRLHPVGSSQGIHAVGITRQKPLQARLACVKRAGLRAAAADHEAYALRRAFPQADAVVDIGYRQTTLHAFAPEVPLSFVVASGGSDITRAIAADLTIDMATAERRKRILGTAGAGDAARDALARQIAGSVTKARERVTIRRIVLTGNGSRLAGLAPAIESAAQLMVEMPVSPLLQAAAYPDDVIRSAAADWSMAAALAAWGAAR